MHDRPLTRAMGQNHPPEHLGAMRADHRQSTVAPISRATASPRTLQPLYHAKALAEARQRMCGSLVDSKNRSCNALPKSEQRVSNKQALTARDKETTMRPPRASGRGFEVPGVLWGWYRL